MTTLAHTNKQKHFSFDLILTYDYVFSSDHADKYRYGVVRHFVGHGVGRVFHADPVVQHFRNNDGGRMMLNQTFTIEPMLTIGSVNPVMWDDNWTVVTEDGSLSAQFEHTILITKDGAEILTQCSSGPARGS
ncbi:PREDICTED: methionine aminopeptidase 1D, chloroplastic/mitochondrial-like [Populus euphratica]|uniref:Methionine aminopeptidase 1D, chloroplastic/mitochondrial-like n=1 Tax=Populus euphratica TaxID=75702 RepID=A0AAJ6T8E6_POPEU|nr:PREDICTED: methionine aminopeptidase 1D, chloroplastic/mitochondrial-like [Populus euphratica]